MVIDSNKFKNYYEKKYKETISNYYKSIKKNKFDVFISNSILIFLIIIIFPLAYYISKPLGYFKVILLILGFLYYIFFFILSHKILFYSSKKIMYEINKMVIKDVISFIGEQINASISIDYNKMLSKNSLSKLELFNFNKTRYIGKNYIDMKYKNNKIIFSDINIFYENLVNRYETVYRNGFKYIKTTKKIKRKNMFDGIYIGLPLKKGIHNKIYFIPNNINDFILQSKISKRIDFHGDNILLENIDINSRYKVFSDNEIETRRVLTLNFMEKINKLDRVFKQKKFIVFKEQNRFSICINGISIESFKENLLPLFRNEKKEELILLELFNTLGNLLKIYDVFN